MPNPSSPKSLCLTRMGALALLATLSACGGGNDNNTDATYQVGGQVSGLASATSLGLQNNGGDTFTLTPGDIVAPELPLRFVFSQRLTSGSSYQVTVSAQPAGQTCVVAQGTGTVTSSDVDSVRVDCSPSTGTPPGGTPPAPVLDVANVTGDWLQHQCVPLGAGVSGRAWVRATRLSDTSVSFAQGVWQYPNSSCSGTGSVLAPATVLGTVVFRDAKATSTLSALWGRWDTITGTSSYVVWARKDSRLCVLGDENPTILPSAAVVEGFFDLPGQQPSCYTQR